VCSGIWADFAAQAMKIATQASRIVPDPSVGAFAKTSAYAVEQNEDREHQADVADDVDDERFNGCGDGRRLEEPEADQKVRCRADEPPAHEQPDEVVGEHEGQHREDEKVHVREKARDRAIAPHIADRVDVDQPADAGDDASPQERERIEPEPEREAAYPVKEMDV
jgi:hypothetical protein